MFEWLFKFSRINFAEGEIGLQAGSSLYWLGGLVLVLGLGLVAAGLLTSIYASRRDRALSLGLRGIVLLLLCIPLLEPVLIMPDIVPEENFVAVLVDASESMTLPDGRFAETRGDDALHLLFERDDDLLSTLDQDFKLRYYTFADRALRTDSLGGLSFDGPATNLSAALERVTADFRGLPLAGIVLMTDGGDNSEAVPINRAEELRSLGIPLHVVGLGSEAFEQEREVLDVSVSRNVEAGTGAEIDVKVRSWGAETEPVAFTLYRGDEPVLTEERPLKGDGLIDQYTFFYEPEEEGTAAYTLALDEARGELNAANNSYPALIDTQPDTFRVLYFEGQLRPDLKFTKRALEDDRAVTFSSVTRTGTGKFYRQGIQSSDELKGGFPASEEALHEYKAVIFGDIEASAFSLEQLQSIEAFVRERGGGFLMLGGRNAFAEGNYADTPIADLLPVRIDPGRANVVPPRFETEAGEQGYRFVPTEAGMESPILKLSPDPDTNRVRWEDMPRFTTINYLGGVKPGGVVLAEKPDDAFGEREPLLAVQQYGKGRSAALPTASLWRWQLELDGEDPRYERFWRQLVRWLTASAPGRVHIDERHLQAVPGEQVELRIEVYDGTYGPYQDADVDGQLTAPDGSVQPLTFRPDIGEAGVFAATMVPKQEGVHALEVTARSQAGEAIGSDRQHVLVVPSRREFQDAAMDRPFLEMMAASSGGYYYEPEEASTIRENIKSRRSSTSVYTTEALWDMPFLFGIVILLLSAEWIYRRRKGLP